MADAALGSRCFIPSRVKRLAQNKGPTKTVIPSLVKRYFIHSWYMLERSTRAQNYRKFTGTMSLNNFLQPTSIKPNNREPWHHRQPEIFRFGIFLPR